VARTFYGYLRATPRLITSVSALVILIWKWTLAASPAAPGESRWVCTDGTDRRTDGRTPDRYNMLPAGRCQHNKWGPYCIFGLSLKSGNTPLSTFMIWQRTWSVALLAHKNGQLQWGKHKCGGKDSRCM